MDYVTYTKRILVSFLTFLSIALWFLFLYFKLWDFAKAAIALRYINVQTVCFIAYSFLLVLLPVAVIYSPRHSKVKLFKAVCLAISITLFVGAVGDMFKFNFFRNYTFLEGDAVFCNIVVSVPNMLGVLCCLILSGLYALLGWKLTTDRVLSFFIYLLIFLLLAVPPFLYSFSAWNGFPRQTWIEKAAFIIPHHFCLLVSFLIASTSEFIWREWIR